MSFNLVPPAEVNRLRESGANIIDIREKDEYRREHIPGAISLPLTEIQSGSKPVISSPHTPIIFHCKAGSRTKQNSAALARSVAPADFMLMEGGIDAWKQAGLSTVKDSRQPLPIMRQVQITAGSIILAGVIAGYALNPAFFLLSGFIGAGLLFAGLSGWCGMANLLSRLPWNKQQEN